MQKYDSGLGFWDWDFEAGEIKISPDWLEMMGYSADDIPTVPKGEGFLSDLINLWASYIHPEDVEQARITLAKYLIFKTISTYSNQFRFRSENGEYIPILSSGFAEWTEKGKLLRFRSTHTDISKITPVERAMFNHLTQTEQTSADTKAAFDTMRQQLIRLRQVLIVVLPTVAATFAAISGTLEVAWETLEMFRFNLDNPTQASTAGPTNGEDINFSEFDLKRYEIIEVLEDNIGAADRAIFAFYEAGPHPTQGKIAAQVKRSGIDWISEKPWNIKGWQLFEDRLESHIQGQLFSVNSIYGGLFDAKLHASAPGVWMSEVGTFVEMPRVWYVAVECRFRSECDLKKMEEDAESARDAVAKILGER